ncbi:hypothetical protein L6164_032038 [Bauhinia variegata]|nr:hypothetical protein L6164_032038 [Bauhinia variegata]
MQKLPNNLGDTRVLYLTLANNKFTGPIPPSIGKAPLLIEVLLLNNQLTGCLPYEIGLLKQLTLFDAGNNLLTGPLPRSLGCLEKVEQFNIAGNFLYGRVPEELCALGNLGNLSLANNYFTGVGPLCKKLISSGVLDVSKNCILELPDQRSVKECQDFFMHPKTCNRPASFNIIPCKNQARKQQGVRPKRNLLSYSALSRKRVSL